MAAEEPAATIAVVTWRRAGLLARCLDSLGPPPPEAEILLVVNGRGPEEAEQAARAAARWPWLRVRLIDRAPRGEARNLAAAAARGRFVHFLDDDVYAEPGFARRLLDALARHPDAPSLGGPNVGPPAASPFQRAVDFLLRSPLGAGPMRARYLRGGREGPAPGWTLMLCNLGFRRELFSVRGLRFPPAAASAEENLLLARVEREAGPALLVPGLVVHHERRPGTASFCRQVFLSGKGRAQITRLDPRSFHPAALAPAALALYAAVLPAFRDAPGAFWPGAVYALACAFETLRLAAFERDPAAAVRLPALFPLAHLSYAAGLLAGLFSRAEEA